MLDKLLARWRKTGPAASLDDAVAQADVAAEALARLLVPEDASFAERWRERLAQAALTRAQPRHQLGLSTLVALLEEGGRVFAVDWRGEPDEVLAAFGSLCSAAGVTAPLYTEEEAERWLEEGPWTLALVALLVARLEPHGIRCLDVYAVSDTVGLVPVPAAHFARARELARQAGATEDLGYDPERNGEPPPGAALP